MSDKLGLLKSCYCSICRSNQSFKRPSRVFDHQYFYLQVFAPGQAIESSLKQLAERRTDIFGVGEESAQEAAIGMKMGEEEKRLADDKIQWDGHTSSAEATARAARANITLNDQV